MSDESLPNHEDIEKYVRDLPRSILDRLPDCIASRRAKQLVDVVVDYAREAREKEPR